MAESVTYADLRFVKVPLKKRISSQLGQDAEADDDGELTYENVQVPPVSGVSSSLASSGPGDKAGVQSEQPTELWSSATSPEAGRLLGCPPAFLKYLGLGLLLTCLLLAMTTISLGVRYLQVSQQLQRTNSVLETTNSSMRQQLHLKTTQLGQREQDLQWSRRELAQSQEARQVEQRDCQAVKEQLEASRADLEETKASLQSGVEQRRTLEERLNRMQDTLKRFPFQCSSDTCCPGGWIPVEKKCIYFSFIKRNWEDSQSYCKSLSSNLTTTYRKLNAVLPKEDWPNSFWIDERWKEGYGDKRNPGSSQRCGYLSQKYWIFSSSDSCTTRRPCICEMAAFQYPFSTELCEVLMPTRACDRHH